MASFATQVQIRRGTDAENDAFTGAEGEVTMDLTNKQLRVHDGQTTGGMKIPNIETVFGTNQIANNAVTEEKIADNAVTGGKIADGAVSLGKLGNNSVNTSKIVNDSITPEKLIGQPTFTGNAGKTLAVNPAGNGFEFIESTLPENSDYVIESQEPTEANGYTWYRLYKSGWVEQGGSVTVSGNTVQLTGTVELPIQMQTDKIVQPLAMYRYLSGQSYTIVTAYYNSSRTNVQVVAQIMGSQSRSSGRLSVIAIGYAV